MTKLKYIALFMILSINLNAQSIESQKAEFALVNIGVSGLVGGIGAMINKQKNDKYSRTLLKGIGQGSLGGIFQVLGKEMTYAVKSKKNLSYAWSAKITNAIGNSIVNNAASNRNFWEKWHFNLGVFRMEYDIVDRDFQIRILTSSLLPVILAGSQAKWNLKKTIQTGSLIFERNGSLNVGKRTSNGFGFVSTIAYNTNGLSESELYDLIAHETMHILQYDNLTWINPLFNKLDIKLKNKSKFYEKVGKFVFLDFNGFALYGLYALQLNRPWPCRFLEREAELYSNRLVLPKCN